MYWVERLSGKDARREVGDATVFHLVGEANSAMLALCVSAPGVPHRVMSSDFGPGPWFATVDETRGADTRHLEILRNELLTYTQASTVRLQALVDLFGDMVQGKPDDPEKHVRRVDALAEMIRNQLAELQVLTQPIK